MNTDGGIRPERKRLVRTGQALLASVILATSAVVAWAQPPSHRARTETSGSGAQSRAGPTDLLEEVFPAGVAALDGSGNNLQHPEWGRAGRMYSRAAHADYADGLGAMVDGPPPRYVSNRVFNDVGQNLFSENGVTQWGFAWGQFIDHNIGLRESGGEVLSIPYDGLDPLEQFTNDFGAIEFERSLAAPGTGFVSPREQINTVSSFIDAWAVYGGTDERLEWIRRGAIDDDLSNNSALLLATPKGYLPRVTARGDAATAPPMQLMGRLFGNPDRAVVAGDVRANENIALTAVHTLFIREHNRIVRKLPKELPSELKFQIARRIVSAEIQHITYNEFLPALGVRLDPYAGYDPTVDTTLSNEFAVVGYRAHSMIHGEMEAEAQASDFTRAERRGLRAQGVEVIRHGEDLEFVIPLNVAFGNPDLLPAIGLNPILAGLGAERQYKNDEMIDNQLRSVLFQLPGPDTPDPSVCLDGPPLPDCFQTVLDLGAIDIMRGRDHGIPPYNGLRQAYGLERVRSFKALTHEGTDEFPVDPLLDTTDPMDDPNSLDFTSLLDIDGNELVPGSEEADEAAVFATRRTTLAARLRALYGDIERVDAFVGMLAEPHLPSSELGPLQLAIWRMQFEALRDGDRFFYLNDPSLPIIEQRFGIGYRHTLSEIIVRNTDFRRRDLPADVFHVPA